MHLSMSLPLSTWKTPFSSGKSSSILMDLGHNTPPHFVGDQDILHLSSIVFPQKRSEGFEYKQFF